MGVIGAFLGCVLIWGSTWYAIELQLGVVPKEWSLFYRFGLASALLFAVCLFRNKGLRLPRSGHVFAAGTGLFLFSGSYYLTYTGTEHLTSGLVAVSFSLMSFLNIINGRLFLGHRIEPNSVMAALLGIVGLIFIFSPEIKALSFEDQTAKGLFFCILATVACSFGNTFAGAPTAARQPLLLFNAWALGYGAMTNLMFAVISGKAPGFDMSLPYVGSFLYLAVLGTVVAFTLYIWLLDQVGVGRAAYVSVMMPLVALTISTFLEGFIWTDAALLGLALVITGNILMARSHRPSPKTEKT